MIGAWIVLWGVWLGLLPILAGKLFWNKKENGGNLLHAWVSGQIVLWAVFFVLSVPLILLEQSFSLLCLIYNVFLVLFIVGPCVFCLLRKRKYPGKAERRQKVPYTRRERLLWIVFVFLLLVQLVLTAVLAYEEGDDAYYIAVATITENSDTMYRIQPYTGLLTGYHDARHSLAPFPVWIAYLARVSGIPAAVVGQVALPIALICMAYGIFSLIACLLFEERDVRKPLFMILVELLTIFGGYSLYSAENFLLVRASQGKAVIANIIIPFLFCILLEGLQKQQDGKRKYWFLTALSLIAGCLCSTMGTLLTCILLGAMGICTAVSYRRWKVLIPIALCCVPPMGVALLYFVIK